MLSLIYSLFEATFVVVTIHRDVAWEEQREVVDVD